MSITAVNDSVVKCWVKYELWPIDNCLVQLWIKLPLIVVPKLYSGLCIYYFYCIPIRHYTMQYYNILFYLLFLHLKAKYPCWRQHWCLHMCYLTFNVPSGIQADKPIKGFEGKTLSRCLMTLGLKRGSCWWINTTTSPYRLIQKSMLMLVTLHV